MKLLRAVDLFCGAGGTSQGLAQACDAASLRLELLAVNHWPIAVETHAANHPSAEHLCESLDSIDPRRAVGPGKLDLLIASPSCTHHSMARGGKPVSDQARASGWHVVRWAEELLPRAILVENVREWMNWGPIGSTGQPLKSRKGETFAAWVRALESLGYTVRHRVLNAANYGAATSRERLFIIATRGRAAVRWPSSTHARQPHQIDGELAPWRAAREVIDWTLRGSSIFARERPLSPNTLRRIAEGLRRFGGAAAEPFLALLTHGGRIRSLDEPLPTVTCAPRGEIALVEPFVLGQQSGSVARPVSSGPLPTLATDGAVALVEPYLIPFFGERPGQTPRTHSVGDPLPVLPASPKYGLVEPFILGQQSNSAPRRVSERPLPTIATAGKVALVEPVAGFDILFRMLAPHELAAGMGFPASYRFAGNRTEQVRQIGNAVEVHQAHALCAAVLAGLAA